MTPLHQKSLVIVMHDHRPIAADLPLMRAGGVTAKVYQVGVDVEIGRNIAVSAGKMKVWAKRALAGIMEAIRTVEEHNESAFIALAATDIERAKREGTIVQIGSADTGRRATRFSCSKTRAW